MIYILHGDNQKDSRDLLLAKLHQNPNTEILHLNAKSINLDQINNFLYGNSLIPGDKILTIDNFFSLPKSTLNKLVPLIANSTVTTYLWQDKTLTTTQLKTFPKSEAKNFRLDNYIFKCLYSIKPKNIRYCLPLFEKVISHNYYDLFLYLLKNHLRKNLNPQNLPTYLQLIKLDYFNKSGRLTLPKEIALKQIIVNLTR